MSDSPLPIPSGYICHTSCAIGKGAATAAARLSSASLSPHRRHARTRLPQFHPREPIFIDHPRRHRSVFSLFLPLPLSPGRPLALSPSPGSYVRSSLARSASSRILPPTERDPATRSFAVNLLLLLSFFSPPRFSRKRETHTVHPSRRQETLSQLFLAILLSFSFAAPSRGKEFVTGGWGSRKRSPSEQ